jgi:ATP-dependent DNA helicase RecG
MEVTMEVRSIVKVLMGELTRQQLQEALSLKNNDYFRKAYLLPAINAGLVQMTLPDKPRSSNQRYRLTAAGRLWLVKHGAGKNN